MIRNIALIASLVLSTMSFAADNSQGLTKVRVFHDMGQSGVQKIDYVVNCADQTLALAGFSVLTDKGRLPVRAVEPTSADLSFYKPMIDHDKNITKNTCEKRMAMNTMPVNN